MKAIAKESKPPRPLAAQPASFRPYEDNYEELMRLCQASGRKPAEELRDLLHEGLQARRQNHGDGSLPAQQPSLNGATMNDMDNLLRQVLQTNSEQTNLILALTRHLREQYGLLLEVLAGAYGARQLAWSYLAEPSLREAGLTPEQINSRFEEERQRWNAERDVTADLLEQAIQSLPSAQ